MDIVVLRDKDSESSGVVIETRGNTAYVAVLGDVPPELVAACCRYAAAGLVGHWPAQRLLGGGGLDGEHPERGGDTRSAPLLRRVPRVALGGTRRVRRGAAAGVVAVVLLLTAAGVADAPGRDQGVAGVDEPVPAPVGPTPTGSGRLTVPAPPTGHRDGVVVVAGSASATAGDDAPPLREAQTLRPLPTSSTAAPSSSPGASAPPGSPSASVPATPPPPPGGGGQDGTPLDVVAVVYRLLHLLLG